jgi:hypothetical protein
LFSPFQGARCRATLTPKPRSYATCEQALSGLSGDRHTHAAAELVCHFTVLCNLAIGYCQIGEPCLCLKGSFIKPSRILEIVHISVSQQQNPVNRGRFLQAAAQNNTEVYFSIRRWSAAIILHPQA